MKINKKFWLKSLRSVVLVFGFTGFLIATFMFSFDYLAKKSEREVPIPTPDYFRLFVTAEGKFDVIKFGELEGFKIINPNYSLLIPKERLEEINENFHLKALEKKVESVPKIKIESEAEGKQTIKISHGGDGIYDFRYEATEKNFKPLTMNRQGPGFIFEPCFITIIIGFVTFCLLKLALWYLRRKNKKVEEIGE